MVAALTLLTPLTPPSPPAVDVSRGVPGEEAGGEGDLSLASTVNIINDMWFAFRERYGLVWGRRVLEQFNASAKHQTLPMTLTWGGFVLSEAVVDETWGKARAILSGLLQRFQPEDLA